MRTITIVIMIAAYSMFASIGKTQTTGVDPASKQNVSSPKPGGGWSSAEGEVAAAEEDAKTKEAASQAAYTQFQEAERRWKDVNRPKIDQPAASAQEVNQAKREYDSAARNVTEKTLEAAAARKNVAVVRENARRTATKDAPSSAAGAPAASVNRLNDLVLKLGPTFDRAYKTNVALQAMQGLKPEGTTSAWFSRPQDVTVEFEKRLKVYGGYYDSDVLAGRVAKSRGVPNVGPSGPVAVPVPNPTPQPTPATTQPDTSSIVGTWAITQGISAGSTWTFSPDGTFSYPGFTGQWQQNGNQVTASLGSNRPGLAFTCTYSITLQGNQGNVSWQCNATQGAVDNTGGSFTMRRK